MTDEYGSDRGVSDVVAFALVFGMVITIVSATFVLGIDSIGALTDDSQMQGAEQQMEAVGATFDDVHRRGSVARTVEIELDGGSLEVVESGVTIREDGSPIPIGDVDTNALELRRDQGTVAYEFGAVTRQNRDGTGGVVVKDPAIYCRETATPGEYKVFISVVELDVAGSPISVAGEDSVELIGRLDSQRVVYATDYTTNKAVTIHLDDPTELPEQTPSNQAALSTYLDRADNWDDVGGGEYRCGPAGPPAAVTEIVVRKTVVTLETQS